MLAGIPSVEIVADECKRGYTTLYVELVRGVEKHCGSGVTKGESYSVNGKNGSLKLKRKVDLSVNTQPQDMLGERLWTDEFLPDPSPGNVRPWGIQCIPIQPRMHQLRTL